MSAPGDTADLPERERFHGIWLAGGSQISEKVADEAAEWLTQAMSGEFTEADSQRLQAWIGAHPDHARAWKHIETVGTSLKLISPENLARQEEVRSPQRRRLLAVLVLCGLGAAAGTRSRFWQGMTADLRTAVGERRQFLLQDGTYLTLNTNSAVNLHIDPTQRIIDLLEGEILVETAHAGSATAALPADSTPQRADFPPLRVRTAEGSIRSLGTRFAVRQQRDLTQVTVFESAVEVSPAARPALSRRLSAGEKLSFTPLVIGQSMRAVDADLAWTRDTLLADNLRLDEFLAELSRYRHGFLTCSTAAGELRISGSFPLSDTDRILAALPNSLPVAIRFVTRFWASVELDPARQK